MAITTLFFLVAYMVCLFGSLFVHPLLGVLGYVMTYVVAPASQWWGSGLAAMGMRYSFFIAGALALGMMFQAKKLTFPGKLYSQEVLFLMLVGWIFLSTYIGLPGYMGDNFAVKLFKVAIFLWMLVRVVDSQKVYEIFLWALILTTTYVAYDALGVSTAQFGRLDRGVGGSDFAEGNFLAAHFAMVLPFVGIYFMRGANKKKFLLLIVSVLMVNGIVLCRSRGVFLALGAGMFSAIFWAPKVWRNKIVVMVIIGLIGSFSLVDKGFIERMGRINVNLSDIEMQDDSAAGRIKAWQAAVEMAQDHPLGIGQGNFSHYVGQYQPEILGKDTHNTYLRALAELGVPGLLLILLMIRNAFKTLRLQKKRIVEHELPSDLLLHVYAQSVALVVFLSAGMFITETYIEEFYWVLMLPVLLERVVDRHLVGYQVVDAKAPEGFKEYTAVAVRGDREG